MIRNLLTYSSGTCCKNANDLPGSVPYPIPPDAMTADPAAPPGASPVRFEAWIRTCGDLVDAIAQGPGVVALIGPAGSGKSTMLAQVSEAFHAAGHPFRPSTEDTFAQLGDSMTVALPGQHATSVETMTLRLIALREDRAADLLQAYPDVRTVRMQPMSSGDVGFFLLTRCQQRGLAADFFAPQTIAALARETACTPEELENFFAQAVIAARPAPARLRAVASLALVVAGSLVLFGATTETRTPAEVIAPPASTETGAPTTPVITPPVPAVSTAEDEPARPAPQAPRISLGLAIPLSPDDAAIDPRRNRAAEAARLVQMAKAYLAAGQVDRAQRLIAVAAGMGNEEAAAAMALRPARTAPAGP
jgi:hypothetical protein